MHGTCEECGFEGDCINTDNDLCAECNGEVETCENCKFPCRTIEERENRK